MKAKKFRGVFDVSKFEVVGVYCTSYCNRGHDTSTGVPIDHDCVKLPPLAIRAEQAGNFEEAQRLLAAKPLQSRKAQRACVKCPLCGSGSRPEDDGTKLFNHGSVGWSCDGRELRTR